MQDLENESLIRAILNRRSRRFGRGLHLQGGPLEFQSALPARPLSLDEEAALAFAACGITGFVSGELPYRSGPTPETGSGHMMTHFWGRTVPSADALHTVTLLVTNDEGCWLIKRPQDFPVDQLPHLIELGQQKQWTQWYQDSRIKIADRRVDVPRKLPYYPTFNQWNCNQAGSTYFLPVNEITELYLTVLFTGLNEEYGYTFLDDRNRFQPAGLRQFLKSQGGWLHDDPRDGRLMTISLLEGWLYELPAIEQGAMLQNLGLMTQALGLGGFPHYAAHPFIWFQELGFDMQELPLSQCYSISGALKWAMKLFNKDLKVPVGLGLTIGGETLIKPYCPPYYANMREAVLAYVDYKFNEKDGIYHGGEKTSAWSRAEQIQSEIPSYSDKNIEAVISYCEYVYEKYGRFPATSGPVRTVMAYQAHHLDGEFYRKFYRPETTADIADSIK